MTERSDERGWADLFKAALDLSLKADTESIENFEALVKLADEGDAVAKRTLRHRWQTSEDPGRKKNALKKTIEDGQARLGNLLSAALPMMLSVSRSAAILRDVEAEAESKGVKADASERLRKKFSDAGGTESLFDRASIDAMRSAVIALRKHAAPANKPSAEVLATLTTLELVGLVAHVFARPIDKALARAAAEGHAGAKSILDCEDMTLATLQIRPIDLAYVSFPDGYDDWKVPIMTPYLWDGVGASPFYQILAREVDPSETGRGPGQEIPLPAYLTYDAMLENEPDFRRLHIEAGNEARLLSSYRELLITKGVTDDVRLPDSAHDDVLDYCFRNEEIYDDRIAWDIWVDWMIKFQTIRRYIDEETPDYESDDTISVWLYLLAGRLASSEAQLPATHRGLLFDWLELPVTFWPVPATRFLVPACLSKAAGPSDPVVRPHLARMQRRLVAIKRESELKIEHAETYGLQRLIHQRLQTASAQPPAKGNIIVPWDRLATLAREHRRSLKRLYIEDHAQRRDGTNAGNLEKGITPAGTALAKLEAIFLANFDALLATSKPA